MSRNNCNDNSGVARDLIDQNKIFYQKDFSLSVNFADEDFRQANEAGFAGLMQLVSRNALYFETFDNRQSRFAGQRTEIGMPADGIDDNGGS